MVEKKYEVLDYLGHVIASGMSLDYAFAFLEGVANKFYLQKFDYRIREMDLNKTMEE